MINEFWPFQINDILFTEPIFFILVRNWILGTIRKLGLKSCIRPRSELYAKLFLPRLPPAGLERPNHLRKQCHVLQPLTFHTSSNLMALFWDTFWALTDRWRCFNHYLSHNSYTLITWIVCMKIMFIFNLKCMIWIEFWFLIGPFVQIIWNT